MEYYLAVKHDILSFAMRWMERENVMLGEISLSDKDKYHMISLTHGNETKQRGRGWGDWGKETVTNRLLTRKQTEGFHSGMGGGRGMGETGDGD